MEAVRKAEHEISALEDKGPAAANAAGTGGGQAEAVVSKAAQREGRAKQVYVEQFVACPMEQLWQHTQQPELHERWDVRFSAIQYLPRNDGEAQRFLYTTRIGFGLHIRGTGATREHEGPEGRKVSALRFNSPQRLSLIRSGAGYWLYEPSADGVRFLTRYTYSTRFGAIGALFDRIVFRPLMGWATAWSFDRLRLWLEKGWRPELTLAMALLHGLSLLLLAGLWLYEGLVPKLLFPSRIELELLGGLGFSEPLARAALGTLGLAEAGLGLLLLVYRRPALYRLQLLVLALLAAAAVWSRPEQLADPFNALTLTVPMLGLTAICLLAHPYAPQAGRCMRKPDEAMASSKGTAEELIKKERSMRNGSSASE